nr:hypothetical protein [Kofleriaceae bacterium]
MRSRFPLCTAVRERAVTIAATTLSLALLAACGHRHGDTYARGTHAEETCCEHLAGDARAACLQQVVRVDDRAVAASDTNQDTYSCVADHFACDASTGHATADSAQQQLVCIQKL